jgi:hypothetical protein
MSIASYVLKGWEYHKGIASVENLNITNKELNDLEIESFLTGYFDNEDIIPVKINKLRESVRDLSPVVDVVGNKLTFISMTLKFIVTKIVKGKLTYAEYMELYEIMNKKYEEINDGTFNSIW